MTGRAQTVGDFLGLPEVPRITPREMIRAAYELFPDDEDCLEADRRLWAMEHPDGQLDDRETVYDYAVRTYFGPHAAVCGLGV